MLASRKWSHRLLAATLLLGPAAASAQIRTLVARLDPSQEVQGPGQPPLLLSSNGRGLFTGTLNVGLRTLDWTLGFSQLSGNTVAVGTMGSPAHIHGPASTTQNAGILLHFIGVPVGVKQDSRSGTFGALSDDQIANLLNGLTYVNIHTDARQAGEIRGQITVTPEPGTWALLATGLGIVGMVARRRRTV